MTDLEKRMLEAMDDGVELAEHFAWHARLFLAIALGEAVLIAAIVVWIVLRAL